MNTELRKKAKKLFEKDLSKLMNNEIFKKAAGNVKNDRYYAYNKRSKKEFQCQNETIMQQNFFSENLLIIEMEKAIMNKPVCQALLISELSKIVIYEFWYDYMKQKYGGKAKLSYMDTGSFIAYIKTENTFTESLQKMLKQDLMLQTMNQKDHYVKEKLKKKLD